MRIDVKNLKDGDEFFECYSGLNFHFRMNSSVSVTEFYSDHFKKNLKQYRWSAVNVKTNEESQFLVTENHEHYGPKLYNSPQYAKFVSGKIEYT